MEKLELKLEHLKYYLDTGLKVAVSNTGTTFEMVVTAKRGCYTIGEILNQSTLKPIFHPLSDLTKEIEHNKEKFVPMKKMFPMWDKLRDFEFTTDLSYQVISTEAYSINFEDWYDNLQKLFEWHFWIFDQSYFEKVIILDINSLNKK